VDSKPVNFYLEKCATRATLRATKSATFCETVRPDEKKKKKTKSAQKCHIHEKYFIIYHKYLTTAHFFIYEPPFPKNFMNFRTFIGLPTVFKVFLSTSLPPEKYFFV